MMDDAKASDDVLDIERDDTRWAPPEGTARHSGDPIEPGADFFVEPPPEIGELVSAETTLSAKTRPWRTVSRIVLAGLIGWGAALILDVILVHNNQVNAKENLVWEALLLLGFAPLTWYFTRFSHTCSFVGKLGIARYRCKGNRDRLAAPEVFFFGDATELRTSQTRHYYNHIYTGTAYTFTWTDGEGSKWFKLKGTYRGENSLPKAKDPFHFALMSEGAWSVFLFDQVVAELEANQSVRFSLGGKHFIAIGPGFLDVFVSGTEPERLTVDEIDGMQADAGVIKIKRIDAQEGWFSSKGVYKFNYEQMANSRLFLLLYTQLIGK